MNKRILVLMVAMAFIFVSCGKKKVSNPGIDMNVSFSAPFYNHTLTDVTYQWDLKDKVIPYSPDYKVYVHFWWGAKKIMLAQDDHDLPGDIESWKKGGKFTYTHKNIFIPDFIDEFDPDFSGKEEVTFTVGLYKPGSKESKIPLFQKKLEFTPLPPDYPEITFGEGWYPEEKTGLGIRDSWRWTSQEASAIIENVQKNLRLYLFAGVDKSVYQDQKVIVKLGDKVLEEFVPEFGHFERIYDLKKEDMGDAEEIKLTVGTDKTWIPSKARGGNDNREVGVQVFMLYLKPVE